MATASLTRAANGQVVRRFRNKRTLVVTASCLAAPSSSSLGAFVRSRCLV
jgi:hypothetical protein